MQLCHTPAALSAAFDEPNLIACAGLVPGVALADRISLQDLADEWLTVPGSTGCVGAKLTSLVVGMLAGADSIDDMDLLAGEIPEQFAMKSAITHLIRLRSTAPTRNPTRAGVRWLR